MSSSIPASVTSPSPNEWTVTAFAITGITKALQAQVTAVAHGMTSTSAGVTFVDFSQVKGMKEINGASGLVQSIVDANNFTVNINSTSFSTYTTGGYVNILTGLPPSTTAGFQTYNTPFVNTYDTNA